MKKKNHIKIEKVKINALFTASQGLLFLRKVFDFHGLHSKAYSRKFSKTQLGTKAVVNLCLPQNKKQLPSLESQLFQESTVPILASKIIVT